ncbi:metal-dependent hydrolase [Sulfuracidifex metallicus]|uniref:metal-dependent hydrolase n=1 Tax=Sulfuracidifex metallicus TaxID=47303 RepID=UPI000B193C23|nr:metal-dependent hydrolase [Sulfuracidifex metallicus]
MNLHTHITFALAISLVLFHGNLELAILVGIGAALPDLDREYVFTSRAIFSRFQLHRALFHNLFFAGIILFFNQYLGLGVVLHMALDLLTSPTDRGIELFFPFGRFIKNFKIDYEGNIKRSKSFMWLLEDPIVLINRTSDIGLRESKGMPWLRVYGPFKNSRLADWTIFYTSFIFIQLFEANNLIGWWEDFIKILFLKYTFITIGIILFYGVGEVWRRRLQFIRLTNFAKAIIAGTMTLGVALLIFQGLELYDPVSFE